MKQFLRQNWLFLALSLMLLVALGLALLFIPKGELHMLLCDRHTPARDFFYMHYTRIAEFLPYIVCVLILLFSTAGNAAFATACVACSELTTQIIKHIVNAPRPVTWFAAHMPDVQLPLIEGLRMNHWFSFPSGHTTSFFSLAFALSILATQSIAAKRSVSVSGLSALAIQLLLFIAAALGGYSRIYLCQHFAADVFGGIAVGLTISVICYAIFRRYEGQKWYNYRLFTKK